MVQGQRIKHHSKSGGIDVSVMICTCNRADTLAEALRSLTTLDLPADIAWEVIVIDNGSTDRTEEVVRDYERSLPIRRAYEERQGRSHARNRALQEANGLLALFIDDDVIVSRQWLRAILSSAKAHPDAGFFTGPILPKYPDGCPSWLCGDLEALLGPFVVRYVPFERDAEIASEGIVPPTANVGLRTDIVSALGLSFDPKLGGNSTCLIRGEDSMFMRDMLRAGVTGRFVKDAQVWHVNDSRRMSMGYLWRWAKGTGMTDAILAAPQGTRCVLGVPRWCIRRLLESGVRLCTVGLLRTEVWVRNWVSAAMAWGYISGYMKKRKE